MVNEHRALTDGELDLVVGGLDGTFCANGTTAGGGPGMYGNNADCNGPGGSGRGGDGVRAFYFAATGKILPE
jgi:hypothetical protein